MDFNTLRVPRALKGLDPMVLDMQLVHLALARVNEKYANANRAVALELMWFFNRAYATACRYYTKIKGECDLAQKRMNETRAIAILDKLPEELKKRGIWDPKHPTGNSEIREAIIALDPDIKEAGTILSTLECWVEYFKGTKETFEMAYNSAKKMLGDAASMATRPNTNLVTTGIQDPTSTPNNDPTFSGGVDDFFGDS